MAYNTREQLKNSFTAGKIPKQVHFYELIDNSLIQSDDGIEKDGPEEPLKIIAGSKGSGPQKLFRFFKLQENGEKEETPSWGIDLISENVLTEDPVLPGLNIFSPTSGESRLFIDEASGKVGLGTTTPKSHLHLEGGNFYLRRPENNCGFLLGVDEEGNTFLNNMDDLEENGTDGNQNLILTSEKDIRFLVKKIIPPDPDPYADPLPPFELQTKMIINENGVGIGMEPTHSLDVKGSINIGQGANTLNLSGNFIIGNNLNLLNFNKPVQIGPSLAVWNYFILLGGTDEKSAWDYLDTLENNQLLVGGCSDQYIQFYWKDGNKNKLWKKIKGDPFLKPN